jgi:hypothetical protein
MQAALTRHRKLTPAAGFIDPATGQDVWAQLHEYCLLQPSQGFHVVALLPPYPPSILLAIKRNELWNGCGKARSWRVLIRVNGRHLNKDDMRKFLQDDAIAQHRPWEIIYNDPASHAPSMGVCEEDHGYHTTVEPPICSVEFRSEVEAMRFWRKWHRMPLPHQAGDTSGPECQAPMLHVELTF